MSAWQATAERWETSNGKQPLGRQGSEIPLDDASGDRLSGPFASGAARPCKDRPRPRPAPIWGFISRLEAAAGPTGRITLRSRVRNAVVSPGFDWEERLGSIPRPLVPGPLPPYAALNLSSRSPR